MQECIGATEVEADPDVPIHHAVAQFCCFAGKLFTFRGTEDDEQKRDLLHALNAYAPGCREALHSLHVPHPKRAEIEMMIKSTDLFIAELCCESGTWGELERLIQQNTIRTEEDSPDDPHLSVRTLEAMASLILRYPLCPSNLTHDVLKAILMMLRVDTPQNINTFARWNRALILHLVNRGSGEDDDAAIYYSIETARKHLESTEVSKHYPIDELRWLWSTCYNKALELRDLGDLGAAHAFCELGMSLSRWCPNLGAGWQKSMQRLYQEIVYRLAERSSRTE
ncbi:hypothetical protein DB88DRAFT_379750 [Papiliotrema laurentii]|uniref:Uncharacterized protein n=1 Tax=Papiliotrema laurentii TaxID=5418 RepID=A0AAD9FJY7_PAPLA|nr:hypothetical protein DB88DRAFT_379750 [Papiliotrema laurentii]